MRPKTLTGSTAVHAATGVAIAMMIYFFTLIAGTSKIEAQTKSAGQQSLDKIVQSLSALDTGVRFG
jgi:hypothetical protein